MRTKLLLVVVVVGLLVVAWGPTASARSGVVWRERAGRELVRIDTDAAGNSYAVGSMGGGFTRSRALIVSWGPSGVERWRRSWDPDGPRTFARGLAITVGANGRVYVAGEVHGGCEGGAWFLAAYTRGGRLLWRRTQGGWRHCSGANLPTGLGIGGGLIAMSGFDYGCCGDPYHDGWVKAFSTDGHIRWTNAFESSRFPHTYDMANDVAVASTGRVFAVGSVATKIDDPSTLRAPDEEVMISKIASTGGTIWTEVLRRRGDHDGDRATAVALRGEALVVSALIDPDSIYGGSPAAQFGKRGWAWLGRFDVGGGLTWARSWGKHQRSAQEPNDVAIREDGSILVGGDARRAGGGIDPTWRRYAAGGALMFKGRVHAHGDRTFANGIAVLNDDAVLCGVRGKRSAGDHPVGRAWRVQTG